MICLDPACTISLQMAEDPETKMTCTGGPQGAKNSLEYVLPRGKSE